MSGKERGPGVVETLKGEAYWGHFCGFCQPAGQQKTETVIFLLAEYSQCTKSRLSVILQAWEDVVFAKKFTTRLIQRYLLLQGR